MSVSIIITTSHEPGTIGKAIQSILPQIGDNDELLIVAPDQATINAASKFAEKNANIKIIRDDEKGKPAAINLGLKNAKNEVIVLTDGDVWVDDEAISELLRSLDNSKVGLVSGRPVSINSTDNMLGFWAHALTDIAHQIRQKIDKLQDTSQHNNLQDDSTETLKNQPKKNVLKHFIVTDFRGNFEFKKNCSDGYSMPQSDLFIEASGYLMAFRKKLIDHVPEESLAEDKVISQIIWQKDYQIRYTENAKVFVKYPDNYSDWLKQKIRSTGGSIQKIIADTPLMRSFWQESGGVIKIFSYAKSLREFFWIILLLLARLHLWWRILIDVKIRKLSRKELWKRVESTK